MTEQEIERLAGLIVAALLRDRRTGAVAPPTPTSDLPVWSGVMLSDVLLPPHAPGPSVIAGAKPVV